MFFTLHFEFSLCNKMIKSLITVIEINLEIIRLIKTTNLKQNCIFYFILTNVNFYVS